VPALAEPSPVAPDGSTPSAADTLPVGDSGPLPGCVPALLGIASADRCAGSRADALLASAVPAFAARGAAACFVAPLQAALRATRASNKPCCNSQQVL